MTLAQKHLLGTTLILLLALVGYGAFTNWEFPAEVYVGPDAASLHWTWWEAVACFWVVLMMIRQLVLWLISREPTQIRAIVWSAVLLIMGAFLYGIWDVLLYVRRMFIYNAEPVWPQVRAAVWFLALLTAVWVWAWLRATRKALPKQTN